MAVTFDNSRVSQVQQANDIVEVISEHVSLSKKGREMVGLCPFHDDHRPSMYVNSAKQIFKCFACGAGGDVLKFVQMRENLTFPQAIERLAERAGIKLKPAKTERSQPEKPPTDGDPNELAKVNAWAAKYFQDNLFDKRKGEDARKYIAERQIPLESVRKWRLGLAVNSRDDLIRSAKAKLIREKLLEQAGLVVGQIGEGSLSDKFVNRLMFTITDVTGRVIGFGGRTLDGMGAKYINSPTTVLFDKSNCLYGLEHARHQIASSETAIAVEGYTDCIMAHSKGIGNVVATMGTSFTSGQGRILRRYAKKVVLIFDSDTAGVEAANRALEVCLSQHIDIKIASVPEGKDPCDFLLSVGKKGFEQLVEKAVDVFQFKWNRLVKGLDKDETLVGKKSAIDEFLQTVATGLQAGNLPAIEKGLIVNRLSRITGLESKEINNELDKRVRRAVKTASYNLENRKVVSINWGEGLCAAAQREILEVLLNEPKLFEAVRQKITDKAFDVPILAQTARILFEMLSIDPTASLAAILGKAETVELGECIVELAQSGEAKGNFESRLTGALDVIGRYQRRRKDNNIQTVKDQRQFLRRVCDNAEKENPHSVGMR